MVSLLQGVFYIITGMWPILSRRSFEKVTGTKVDFWLVQTTGALITVIGSVLALSGIRKKASPEMALLAVGSAASLTGADVIFASRKRISRIYLLDAVGEAGMIILWALGWVFPKRSAGASVLKLPPE